MRTLLKAGELRGIQIGGRGLWRIGATDAYRINAEKIETGEIPDADPEH